MIKYILTLVAVCHLLVCNGQDNNLPTPLNEIEITQKVDALVKDYVDLGIFSGVVVVGKEGKPFYQKAFGLADRDKNILNTLETVFSIGSMNKSFTRVLILQLMEEGKLKPTDKLVQCLDGFNQEHADKITIAHLLDHTSGFGDYHGPDYFNLPFEKKNIQGVLPIVQEMSLLFEPGTGNEYSNAGYILLGAIVEKITRKSYAQNIEERIAKPLALKNLVTHHVKETPNRAIGYLKTFDGYENNEQFIAEPKSDGGLYANALDILKFYRAYFYGNTLINETTRKEDGFFKRIEKSFNQKGAGIPLAGGFNGANTVHMEMLADNISIVVFANMDAPVAEQLAFGIHSIINNKTPEKPTLPVKLNVYSAYKDKGVDYVKNNFEGLSKGWPERDPKDIILNMLGYDLLFSGKSEEALEMFKLNTELFPNIGNCWDSYGEALLSKGDRAGALAAYKKALEINPNIPSAKKAVEELEE